MTDYVDLAIKYGGYTSLDRVYLTNLLSTIPEEIASPCDYASPKCDQRLFAELYQKKSPKEAMDYFLDLSRAFDLFTVQQTLMNGSLLSASTYQGSLMAWLT